MLILNLQEAFFREREIANKAQANEDIAADIKEEKADTSSSSLFVYGNLLLLVKSKKPKTVSLIFLSLLFRWLPLSLSSQKHPYHHHVP